MLFSSMLFLWIFFPAVFILNFILYKLTGCKGSNVLLLIASLIFYAWGEPVYVFLMLGSIVLNWMFGLLIGKAEKKPAKKAALVIAVILNLGVLGFFKYLGMLTTMLVSLTGLSIGTGAELPLPIGISFYTFQAMSYVIDVYRGDCRYQKNPFRLGLYISFFPQLIAGPILRYKDIEGQLSDRALTWEKTAEGIRRFLYGLGKKVLIANMLAYGADYLYGADILQITGPLAWAASLLYTFQIYYDFSGYSDMAIGLGRIFGFQFRENFVYPYTSLSIREFWRRWHISLSSWFKEYVYIPLGGNRKGTGRTYLNLVIVFFLTGLWHGASICFIFWGLYHGLFSILERLGYGNWLKKHKGIAGIYTFLVVNFGWVFFRVGDIGTAFQYLVRMILPWKYTGGTILPAELFQPHMIAVMAAAVLGAGVFQRILEKSAVWKKWTHSAAEYIFLILVFALCVMSLASDTYNPFIYFRF